jgi:hypothetical protein
MWLILLVVDLLHPLMYQPWTPDAVQSWWYEHVCQRLGEMEL